MSARQQYLDRVAELEAEREAVIERVFAMQSRLRALKREIGEVKQSLAALPPGDA